MQIINFQVGILFPTVLKNFLLFGFTKFQEQSIHNANNSLEITVIFCLCLINFLPLPLITELPVLLRGSVHIAG